MLLRRALMLMLMALGLAALPARCPAATTPTEAKAVQFAQHDSTAYHLPPEKMRKAVGLTRIRDVYYPAAEIWLPLQLVLILSVGWVGRMRDIAVGLSRNRWAQGFSFVFLFLLTTTLLTLPLDIYRHHVSMSYGFSVQGWASWLGDQAKSFALTWMVGGLLTMILFWVIRKSATRWWLWFWMVAAAVTVAGIFITPYVIDPLFNKFEPLSKSNPALVERLEQVVARGGIAIPPERMFLMKASAKVTTLNAYVTGFGASKRVVVWDTTIAKATPDEIAFIFAHESGHYALNHVRIGVEVSCVALLPFFWLGYHAVRWLLARYGGRWRIPGQQDWGALVVLVLVLSVLSTVSEPIGNGFSRMIEHNADVYGQEAMHGIVADPQTLARQSFQVLGEESLDDPTPDPFFEFWFDNHPPTRFRAAFAEAYDPWAPDEHPKYFMK
ncbi:MAG TPA: M48 family metallopeptidase [Acidobacteriaceae bacterium]